MIVDVCKTPLFEGIPEEKIERILACLNAEEIVIPKGKYIVHQHKSIPKTLYLLTGRFQAIKEDYDGNRSILCEYHAGSVIAPELVYKITSPQVHDLLAVEDCTFVALRISDAVAAKPCCQKYIDTVKRNLAQINLDMTHDLLRKLDLISNRSIKTKVLAYMQEQSKKTGSNTFTIAHSRQELADLLYIDRSALSHELSRLKSEGYLDYVRNTFTILK